MEEDNDSTRDSTFFGSVYMNKDLTRVKGWNGGIRD